MSFIALLVVCGSFYDVFLQDLVLMRMRRGIDDSATEAVENEYESDRKVDEEQSDIATTSADGDDKDEIESEMGLEKDEKCIAMTETTKTRLNPRWD